jgi:sulfur carrier protein
MTAVARAKTPSGCATSDATNMPADPTVEIVVNGGPVTIPAGASVRQLIAQLGLEGPVAVEVNREIVPRATHEACVLQANDVVEIVRFVGGG